jgi:hypothetical protein
VTENNATTMHDWYMQCNAALLAMQEVPFVTFKKVMLGRNNLSLLVNLNAAGVAVRDACVAILGSKYEKSKSNLSLVYSPLLDPPPDASETAYAPIALRFQLDGVQILKHRFLGFDHGFNADADLSAR